MRKLYLCSFLIGFFALACGMWSCSDDDSNNGDTTVIEVETPASDAIFATSATFNLKTKGAESYVYKVIEGSNAAEPDPVIAYAEAQENGTIVTVTGDTAQETVTGLEGNKTYTVFFIFKVGNEYRILSQTITTPNYSQMVTIVKTDMFSTTFHVEVPEDVYYMINFVDYETYINYQMQFGRNDVDWTVAGFGMQSPRFKGPQTITVKNGGNAYEGALNEADYPADAYTYSIYPGTGYVLFVSQCDENGSTDNYVEYSEGEGGDPGILLSTLPNVKQYTEEKPSSESLSFNGLYAKTMFFTKQADKGAGEVMVNIDRITEQTALLTLTPTEDVMQYAVVLVSDDDKQLYLDLFGGEDGLQASLIIYGSIYDGVQQLPYPIEKGKSYTLYITAIYNQEGTVQSFHTLEGIKAIESDKPAVELEITPKQVSNPYQVCFNIKAPNGDCAAFKYLCNYTKDWYPTLNGLTGTDLEENVASMVSMYGVMVSDAEVMTGINSPEGYDLYFTSIDETETWLVLESYNVDEKTKLFYQEEGCRTTSAALTPEEPVNSQLFNKLLGNWTATMESAYGNGTVTMPVTIAAGPEQVSTLPSDVKEELVNYFIASGKTQEQAEEMVESSFNEYKDRAAYYTQKNKDQNCLVATGFSYDEWNAPFASSWDLFHSTEYSAYSTDELFRDYGPKLFFKIAKDQNGNDSVSVITTRYAENGYDYLRYVDPVSDWYRTLVLCAYNQENSGNYYTTEFPVEISEDMNTITIKPVEQEGLYYCPGFAIEYMPGYPSWNFPTTQSGIVLTRATDENMQTATSRSVSEIKTPKVSARSGNHFRRTRAPYDYVAKKSVKCETFSLDNLKKDLKK